MIASSGIDPEVARSRLVYTDLSILDSEGTIDVNALSTSSGETPLLDAVDSGKIEVAQMLIERGAKVNRAGKGDITPLHAAAGYGHADLVKLFLALGAETGAKDEEGDTAAEYAAVGRSEEVAKIFADVSRSPDAALRQYKDEFVPGHAETRQAKEAERLAKKKAEERENKIAMEFSRMQAQEARYKAAVSESFQRRSKRRPTLW